MAHENKRIITAQITIECANDAQHLAISNMIKTILSVVDMAVEGKHPGNNFVYTLRGEHLSSVTNMPSKAAIDHAMSIGQVKSK